MKMQSGIPPLYRFKPIPYNKIKHVSNDPHLAACHLSEKVFASVWAEKNKRSPGLNHGCGYLELIVAPEGKDGGERRVEPISPRDATVAASVIQWLGTNCGLAFVTECEEIIKKCQEAGEKEWVDTSVEDSLHFEPGVAVIVGKLNDTIIEKTQKLKASESRCNDLGLEVESQHQQIVQLRQELHLYKSIASVGVAPEPDSRLVGARLNNIEGTE